MKYDIDITIGPHNIKTVQILFIKLPQTFKNGFGGNRTIRPTSSPGSKDPGSTL